MNTNNVLAHMESLEKRIHTQDISELFHYIEIFFKLQFSVDMHFLD